VSRETVMIRLQMDSIMRIKKKSKLFQIADDRIPEIAGYRSCQGKKDRRIGE
jgi:hypothetical protein